MFPIFEFTRRYIANMIGAACNSRIPQANLHAVLNLYMQRIAATAIILFIFESFVS